MSFSLLPKLIVGTVTELTPQVLKNRGIRLLMLDFDNTLVPYTTDEPTQELLSWLQQLRQEGITLCVVSNSKRQRVRVFSEKYGLDCITHSKKPFPRGICQCLERYKVPAAACGLAGDQIFTDTLGANCQGVQSLLVKPINNHNFWLKARHVLEQPFIFAARKRRISYEES